MLIYKNTFENIKTIDCKFPMEDQYYATDNEAIVADGITRDPIGINDFSSCTFEEFLRKYPRPSGGELAAKEIVKEFPKTRRTLKERLKLCNLKVKELNEKYIEKCDYLENDYFGAVASCVSINNNILNYAFICDCGVIVYDKLGNIKFQTEDEKEKYSDPYINEIGISWNLPDARVIVRKEYRNNLNNVKDNKCVSYGAFTGEDAANEFIRSGNIKLSPGDIILTYSDGFTNFLHDKDFIDHIINFNKMKFEKYVDNLSQTNYDKYGKEKTIVILKNETDNI